jgi:transcriptional regulator with XRE-family HTH domain
MPKKGHRELFLQFNLELGLRIQAARQARSLTQDQLAELAGMNRPTIGMIETGRQGVDALNLVLLATALRKSPTALLPKLPLTRRKK